MSFSIISFTEKGIILSQKIRHEWDGEEAVLYTKCKSADIKRQHELYRYVEEGISEWAGKQMKERNTLLFIGACGIAVRAIAPWITDKLHDSPVLVMDEKGKYVIPILSGHMGGANEIAVTLAEKMGAEPVITTATDINKRFAVDLFAKKNALCIVNKEGIAKVSAKALAGQELTMSVETGHLNKMETKFERLPEGIRLVPYPPADFVDIMITSENHIDKDNSVICEKGTEYFTMAETCTELKRSSILLRPKEYVIGMGCKKGKEPEKIEKFILHTLAEEGISVNQVFALASIDRKKEEIGFVTWSKKENVPFLTYSVDELKEVEGNFHSSDFVKEQVGVDNVCERAALKACGPGGKLIRGKHAEDGMTIAIAKREWRVTFDEK